MSPIENVPGAQRNVLVALTRDGLEHRYVINRLAAKHHLAAVVIDERVRSGGLRRSLRHGLRSFTSRALLKAYLKVSGDTAARDRALRDVLGIDMVKEWKTPEGSLHRVDGVNSEAAIELVNSFQPGALLIYGTSIVKASMLGVARDIALNMHTGLSPHYRGTHCAFWPIVNGEPHMLGATVHECTAEIDGGQIFATAATCPEPGDTIHHCFARAVIAGTDAYLRVVEQYLAGTLSGTRQDLSTGREYRGHMRTLSAELRARRALRRRSEQR